MYKKTNGFLGASKRGFPVIIGFQLFRLFRLFRFKKRFSA